MTFLFRLVYDIGIQLFWVAMCIAAVFHPKARDFVRGRKDLFTALQKQLETAHRTANTTANTTAPIWVLVTSLGEFEQIRPLIERIKATHPHTGFVLSFFSPSGYKARANYPHAEAVSYLPLDTKKNAQRMLALIRPRALLIVKHELWYHVITQAHKQQLPVMALSVNFHRKDWFFKRRGVLHKPLLAGLEAIFVRDEDSAMQAAAAGLRNTHVTGDMRFDRVAANAKTMPTIPHIDVFKANTPLMLWGSVWPSDWKRLQQSCVQMAGTWKHIIAPHEIDEHFLRTLEAAFEGHALRYSLATPTNIRHTPVLLIDSIGLLAKLYAYADLAYVGGGFQGGLHNILEPAAYAVPILFGNRIFYDRFKEAKALLHAGAAQAVKDQQHFEHALERWKNPRIRQAAGQKALAYVRQQQGATARTLVYIEKKLQL